MAENYEKTIKFNCRVQLVVNFLKSQFYYVIGYLIQSSLIAELIGVSSSVILLFSLPTNSQRCREQVIVPYESVLVKYYLQITVV